MDSDSTPQRTAWWLTTRRPRSEWQQLSGAGLATFSGRPRANFAQAQTGDPVLLYVARPDRAIRAVGIITHVGGGPEEGDDLHIEVQWAFGVSSPLPWAAIAAMPELSEAEPVKGRNSGTLSYLKPPEYALLQEAIIARNPELDAAFAALNAGLLRPTEPPAMDEMRRAEGLREQAAPYTIPASSSSSPASPTALPAVDSLSRLQELTGLPVSFLEEARELLEETGQIVLSGPPGTGKTWLARGLAALVAGDPARVQVVQFHPATSYEDFIEGLKPSVDAWGHVTYAVLPGLFVRLCRQAARDPEQPYVLIIDEINRAPLARVFGELLYALEYRGPQGAVELAVSAGVGGPPTPFYVPENLLLIGTMNSADRSLALVDYALRRRFRFLEVAPNASVLDGWLVAHGAPAPARAVILDLFGRVNSRLADALDPDHQLGHSYFMLDPADAPALDRLWRTAVRPLIAEYFIPPAGELAEYAALFAEATESLRG